MSNLSDFIKNSKNKNNTEPTTSNNSNSNAQLENMINTYSKMSEGDLLNEFVSKTIERKMRGELSGEELEKIKTTIEPMLNENQKIKLSEMIELVKNV